MDALLAEVADLRRRTAEVMSAVEAHSNDVDPDAAVVIGRAIKDMRLACNGAYTIVKDTLWTAAGCQCGDVRTPGGERVQFKRMGTTSRKVDFKRLASTYPAAYADVVTETAKDLTKPGNLYL